MTAAVSCRLLPIPKAQAAASKTAEDIRNEYVIKVIGNVRLRDEDTINENIPTGTIEVLAHDIEVLNGAKTPPFYIKDGIDTDENLRLKSGLSGPAPSGNATQSDSASQGC